MAPDPRLPISTFPNESTFVRLLVGSDRQEVVASLPIVNKMPAMLRSARVQTNQVNVGGEIVMEEDKVQIVVIYLEYLNAGKILCKYPQGSADAHDKEHNLLAEFYCFGERYQDTKLKNTVIDALVAKSRDSTSAAQEPMPSEYVVRALFDHSSKHSPVRRLLVDMYVKHGNSVTTGWASDGGVGEFLAELIVKRLGKQDQGAQGTNKDQTALNSEDYHEMEGAPSTETRK